MTIINLCERFGCLPSALLAEDAEIFRMVRMVDREREVNGDGERPSGMSGMDDGMSGMDGIEADATMGGDW